MDIDQVKELVRLMVDNDLSSISLRDGGQEITLHRPSHNHAAHVRDDPGAGAVLTATSPTAPLSAAPPAASTGAAVDDGLVAILSPMVGTFYTRSAPEAPPFVQMGSPVTPQTVVCIIEAMKVFNEIHADVSGSIEKILVGNERPVEYGQPLFMVRPQ